MSRFRIKLQSSLFLMKWMKLALAIGAVNTVVKENGRFIGYNTDGIGFYKSLCD